MGVNLLELEESNIMLVNHTTFPRRIPVFFLVGSISSKGEVRDGFYL